MEEQCFTSIHQVVSLFAISYQDNFDVYDCTLHMDAPWAIASYNHCTGSSRSRLYWNRSRGCALQGTSNVCYTAAGRRTALPMSSLLRWGRNGKSSRRLRPPATWVPQLVLPRRGGLPGVWLSLRVEHGCSVIENWERRIDEEAS